MISKVIQNRMIDILLSTIVIITLYHLFGNTETLELPCTIITHRQCETLLCSDTSAGQAMVTGSLRSVKKWKNTEKGSH